MGDKRCDFQRLKEPADLLAYTQRLINRLRRENLELDPVYIGKIIYLLNTWLNAYKIQMEHIEVKQLREEIDGLKAIVGDQDAKIRLTNH